MDTPAYSVYILECTDGTLYTGIATNLKKRFAEHKKGTAAKYTRAHGAKAIRYAERCKNRSEALKREMHIKRLSRLEKMCIIRRKPFDD